MNIDVYIWFFILVNSKKTSCFDAWTYRKSTIWLKRHSISNYLSLCTIEVWNNGFPDSFAFLLQGIHVLNKRSLIYYLYFFLNFMAFHCYKFYNFFFYFFSFFLFLEKGVVTLSSEVCFKEASKNKNNQNMIQVCTILYWIYLPWLKWSYLDISELMHEQKLWNKPV